MTISYIAVDRGLRSDGYLVVNGQAFVARSGGLEGTRGEIPAGTYVLGEAQGLSQANRRTMSDGRNPSSFRKFAIEGTAANRQFNQKEGVWGVRDARYPNDPRTYLRFHYDGDVLGSAGCIAYDDQAAQTALERAYENGNREVRVVYVADDATVRRMTQELVGDQALPENTRPW